MSVGVTWHSRGMTSSIRDDWETPRDLFYFIGKEFKLVLDVCATAKTAKTGRWFGPEDDGLQKSWKVAPGCAVWMNPPYGREIGKWVRKAWLESIMMDGPTVVCLLPARTDTSWWHDYCMKGEIRFLRGRLRFDNERRGRCPFPSAIVIFLPTSRISRDFMERLGAQDLIKEECLETTTK